MSLNPRLVADIMVKRLGMPDASQSAAIIMQIPQALKETGRRIAADPSTRDMLLSDKTVAQVAIGSNGKVNLVTAYNTYYVLKEFINHGHMYLLQTATFGTSEVDTTNDEILIRYKRLAVGDRVQFTSTGTLPTGLSLATDYFVKTWDATNEEFSLSTTAALTDTVDLQNTGSSTHTVTVFETAGFPLQRLADPSLAPYDRYLDEIYYYFYIQGDTLQVLPQSLTGEVAFAVPTYPTNLAALPDSLEAENIFLETLHAILLNTPGMSK